MPKISVIMPSFLGLYRGAATNRPTKLIRAIKSVLKQSMPDFELVIVADGCQETVDIVKQNFTDKRISLYQIRKQPTWSGRVRNAGIEKAKSDWICYLDIDDMFGTNHLQILTDNLKGDWVWFNDLTYTLETQSFLEVHEDINVRGKCGTSTIAHKKNLKARWVENGDYKHDWYFIQSLKKSSNDYHRIPTCEYLICHLPSLLDV